MATAPAATPEPDLDEMLRILDAASALRRERELVREQLSVDEFRATLRDRLLAAASATGDPVKPEEVEAAIDTYFDRLHAYDDPPMTVGVALAHVYVNRWPILTWGWLTLGALLLGWWIFFRPASPLGLVGGRERALARISAEAERDLAAARGLAAEPAAAGRIDRLAREAATYRRQGDAEKLGGVEKELERLVAAMESEYVVEVVHAAGKKSAVDRYFRDAEGKRVSGYYLIVEARDPAGQMVKLPIRNAESDRSATVSTWAERVPKEVYDRLAADKRADGRLDEFVYAVKEKGKLEPEVRMPGADGGPLTRLGQITEW